MSSTVDKIKERLNIVDVVGSYVKLERAGINYKAPCPFHNEKTPSFFVSPARESYHCFGCNRGGDIFSFVQEIEGLDFLGSLKLLAERAGVEVEALSPHVDEKQARLYKLLDEAARFFQHQLTKNPAAQEYLTNRGLTAETISKFALGYIPNEWRLLTEYLTKLNFTTEEMEKVGLVAEAKTGAGIKGARHYDRFRGRIMFPLLDSTGRTVGFSGRLFPDAGRDEAKYINSPQTALYDKSRLLYGFHLAKVPIRRLNQAILVEGQMDLVLSHQAGLDNTVAVSGTALTETHLLNLKRLTPAVVMAFDQDLAGVNAARRAIDMALALGLEVRAAMIPTGKDPADVIKENPAAWLEAVKDSKHVIDFYLAVLSGKGYDSRALRLAVSKEVLPYIARLENAIDQAHFVNRVAQVLNLPEEPIWQEVRKVGSKNISPPPDSAAEITKPGRKEIIKERLQAFLLWANQKTELDHLATQIDSQLIANLQPEEKNKLLLEGELLYAEKEKLAEDITDLITQYRSETLKEELALLMEKIRQAEGAGDHGALDIYLKKCQSISQELQTLNNPQA